ncbi:MAG: beta-lactamase family protein [Acetobacteraceae bacterium]|nr:beta-lactamase family protein [Acetobacteraceae bacterium]
MSFPLPQAEPASLGLDPARVERLCAAVAADVAAGGSKGAQVALARHGKLALHRSFGEAARGVPARDDHLWLIYSNTKVMTAAGLWLLAEEGALRLTDPVAKHLPGFEAGGKGEITFVELLTHQAGFPDAVVPPEAWEDAELLRRTVCGFALQWEPGGRMHYHPAAAHWVAAAVIRAVTGQDHRAFLHRRIVAPLGLGAELFVGLSEAEHGRAAAMHDPDGRERMPECSAAHRQAGVPGGGGYATARGMAAFYQSLLGYGPQAVSPRMVRYATRDWTGGRVDESFGVPTWRGLGPQLRGPAPTSRGMGDITHPGAFGHGGVGSSFCWGDPESGLSFAYISNTRQEEEHHLARLNRLGNLASACVAG